MKVVDTDSIDMIIKNRGFEHEYAFANIRLTAWLKQQLNEALFVSQEAQFRRMLYELAPEITQPFGGSDTKPMTESQKQKVIEVVCLLGYEFQEYIAEQLYWYCQERLQHYKILVRYYQQKYKVKDYQDFSNRFHIYSFDVLEKEEDSMAWEDALYAIDDYQKQIKALEL